MNQTLSQTKFTVSAKTALLRRGMTVTALAKKLGYSRNAVSLAINHPILPTVRRRIANELSLEGAK